MSDKKTVKDEAPTYDPHPKGQFAARCGDVIDLGFKVESFQQQAPELKDKTALVFRTDAEAREDGKPMHISQEFTTSMGKKANLRKFLEAWRGEPYTDDEAKKGIPLDKLEGVPALITVAHKTSGRGNTYAVIAGIAPLPRKMLADAPTLEGFERAEFWAKRKAEYAAGAQAHADKFPTGPKAAEDVPDPEYAEDDLDETMPF